MGVRNLAILCAALLPTAAPAGSMSCTVTTQCTARGCEDPTRPTTFGLQIDAAATLMLGGDNGTVTLPAHTGPVPERMQVFSGLDGNALVVLSLRHDGAVTLSLHAGRSPGAFANNSTLSMGRCEETR